MELLRACRAFLPKRKNSMIFYRKLCPVSAAILFGLVLGLPLRAQVLDPSQCGWHDHMYLQPGDGVQLNRQQEPKFPGVILMSQTGTSQYIGSGSDSTYLAQHTYDMIKTVNANGSVSLSSFAVDGDVDVSFFGRETFSENDFVFVETILSPPLWTYFTPLGYSPAFMNQIGVYQKSLSGTALYSAITRTFGTHYVTGYQSQNVVMVVYRFHFASAASKQYSSITGSFSAGPVDISTVVTRAFADTNTTTDLSYQFYSSDPNLIATNLGVAAVGIIQNPNEFTNFWTGIHTYFHSMTNGKITGYSLDSLNDVPGFSGLGISNPTTNYPANYSSFLQDYSALQAYKQTLDPWILDGHSTSWLNGLGRQTLLQDWFQADQYLATLKTICLSHFASNAPLNEPANIAGFAGALPILKFPTLYFVKSFTIGSSYYFLGRVDCGCRDLTIPIPFSHISELQNGTNNGTIVPIYYDPVDFEKAQLASSTSTLHTDLLNYFTNVTTSWPCLTNQPNELNGFFLVEQNSSQTALWNLVINGGTDANGNPVVVDQIALNDNGRSGSCSSSPPGCQLTITNFVTGISAPLANSTVPDAARTPTAPASGRKILQ